MTNDTYDEITGEEYNHINRMIYRIGAILLILSLLVIILVSTTGCVSLAKGALMEPVPEPTPVPTTIPTTEPTPEPVYAPDYSNCDAATNCYHVGEWHHMYIPEVQGDGIDLVLHATVYDWKIIDGPYHYHSVTQGTRAFADHYPYSGFKYLIVMVNVYSDTDANPYGFKRSDWVVQDRDRIYYYDWDYDPTKWIWELQDRFSYDRSTAVQPYGYRIVQERITGIITAQELGQIYKGRSNAWDGFIIYEIPIEARPQDIKIGANFANIGGYSWWTLL